MHFPVYKRLMMAIDDRNVWQKEDLNKLILSTFQLISYLLDV
jgi:hypothetical protein